MTTYTTVEKLYQDKDRLIEAKKHFMPLTARDIMNRMNGYLDVLEFDAVRLGDTS